MIQPVQSASSAPSIPFQPSIVNPLYKDHFGISTLTQASAPRKAFIVLGFLAFATVLIIFLKKLFSTEPSKIQAWVKENCKDLDASHQELLARVIAMTKDETKSMVNPSLRAVIPNYKIEGCSCSVCKNIKIYILSYFEAHESKPNEIDAWVKQKCSHLNEDGKFTVAKVIWLTSLQMESVVKLDVEKFAGTFFQVIAQRRREEDWKSIACVLRYFRDKNQEIQTWLLESEFKNTFQEVVAQVVQRVNEIEILPAYSEGPRNLIRRLRLKTFLKPDNIQSIALSYLTHARNQADIKYKYGKK